MATDRSSQDDGLDAFFAAARRDGAVPATLFDRIMADAAAESGLAAAPAIAAPRRGGLVSGLLAAIGGWPAMAGMAAASMTGVFLGFASPTTLDGVLAMTPDYTVGDFLPTIDLGDGS